MRYLIVLALCLMPTLVSAQIKLIELKVDRETWVGFVNPVINSDGSITTALGSKPTQVPGVVKYKVETVVPYKFGDMEAIRVSTNEEVRLDKEPNAEIYWFRSGATAGKYRWKYTAYDPEKGIAKDYFDIDYNPAQPTPGPDPIDPVTPSQLSTLAESSKNEMQGYVRRMASDMRMASEEIARGDLKTLGAIQQRGQVLDLLTRNAWKQGIGRVMNANISDPPNAQEFVEIAIGYEAAIK